MKDEELIAAMRDLSAGPSSYLQDVGNAAADRIEQLAATNEALVKERDDAVVKRAAWVVEAKMLRAEVEKLRGALEKVELQSKTPGIAKRALGFTARAALKGDDHE